MKKSLFIFCALGLVVWLGSPYLVHKANQNAKREAAKLAVELIGIVDQIYQEKGVYVEIIISEFKKPVKVTIGNKQVEISAKMEITPYFEQRRVEELKASAGGVIADSVEVKEILKYTYAKVKEKYPKAPEFYNASVKVVADGFNFSEKVESLKKQAHDL